MDSDLDHCFVVFANKNMAVMEKNRDRWRTLNASHRTLWVTPFAERVGELGATQILRVSEEASFDQNFARAVQRIEEEGCRMFTPVADDDLVHRPDEVVRTACSYADDDGVRALVFDHDQYYFSEDDRVERSEPVTRFDYAELPRFIGITYKRSAGMGKLAEKYEATNHAYAGLLYRACPREQIVAVNQTLFSYYFVPGRTWSWTSWPRVHRGIIRLAASLRLDEVAPEVVEAWIYRSYNLSRNAERVAAYSPVQRFTRRLCRSLCKRAKILPPP